MRYEVGYRTAGPPAGPHCLGHHLWPVVPRRIDNRQLTRTLGDDIHTVGQLIARSYLPELAPERLRRMLLRDTQQG
jgi:hypothetical protein